jgi:hypothetical protein
MFFRGLGLTNKTMTPGEKGELGEKFVERLLKDPFLTVKNVATGQTKYADLIVSFKRDSAKVRYEAAKMPKNGENCLLS